MPYLTVYVAPAGTSIEHEPNTGLPGTSLAGHVWYSIAKDDGLAGSPFGFAPIQQGDWSGAGTVYKNDTGNYGLKQDSPTVWSKTIYITQDQYDKLLAFGSFPEEFGFNMYYVAASNNCIDFVNAALTYAFGIDNFHFPLTQAWPTEDISHITAVLDQVADQNMQNLLSPENVTLTDPITNYDGSQTRTMLNQDGQRVAEVQSYSLIQTAQKSNSFMTRLPRS